MNNHAEFNIFSEKSARSFLIFPSIFPNFYDYGFPNLGGGGGAVLFGDLFGLP
jgi:hypothetical protein